jgi:hypothetical protein
MKKIVPLFFSLALVMQAGAQEEQKKEPFIRRGLLRNEATFSTGSMFSQGVTNVYLQGGIEYYISDNVSIRGEGYYFVTSLGNFQPFAFHHSVMSGASYHFKTKNHFDPYFGLAPGISITAMNVPTGIYCDPGPCTGETMAGKTNIDPLATLHLGFNLYFQRWFHLFMETNYIYGRHFSDYPAESLSELRFSFGLGWNIFVLKKPKV